MNMIHKINCKIGQALLLATLCSVAVCTLSNAQTNPQSKTEVIIRPDYIVLLTGSTIECKVVAIGKEDIRYKRVESDMDTTTRSIRRTSVAKVRFANGTEVAIAETTSENVKSSEKVTPMDKEALQPAPKYNQSSPPARIPWAMINTTFGGDFTYYPSFINKQWAQRETGYNLDFTYGPSLRFDFRPIQLLALSIGGGFSQFDLTRTFRSEESVEQELYTEKQTLRQIPLYAGIKVYLIKNFYVLPRSGVTLLKTSVETSSEHPAPNADEQIDSRPLLFGVGAGNEFHFKGGIMLDMSLHFDYQATKTLELVSIAQKYDKSLNSVTLRVGIGFDALRR